MTRLHAWRLLPALLVPNTVEARAVCSVRGVEARNEVQRAEQICVAELLAIESESPLPTDHDGVVAQLLDGGHVESHSDPTSLRESSSHAVRTMSQHLVTKVATCVLASVPLALLWSAWRTTGGTGGDQAVVVGLALGSLVVGIGLLATPFWRLTQPRTLRLLMVAASLLAATSVGLRPTLDGAMARASGLFDASRPWSAATAVVRGERFDHPMGGYSLTLPEGWSRQEHDSTGQATFRLEGENGPEAALLPSCWAGEDLVEVVTRSVRGGSSGTPPSETWECAKIGELEACRFERISSNDEHGARRRVELWLQPPRAGYGARLVFLTHRAHDPAEFSAIAASVAIEPNEAPVDCPIPTAWALVEGSSDG